MSRTSTGWMVVVVCVVSLLLGGNAEAGHRLTPQRLRKGDAIVVSQRNQVIVQIQAATKPARTKYQATLQKRATLAQKKLEQLKSSKGTAKEQQSLLRTLVAPNAALAPENVTAADIEKSAADPEIVQATKEVMAAKAATDAAIPAQLQTQATALGMTGEDLTAAAESDNPPAAPASLFSSAPLTGTSWQTSVVSGLAQFLAARANEELALWLADEIAERICDANAKGATWSPAQLFPATCKVVGTQSGDPSQLGGLLASALRADLEALPFVVLGHYLQMDQPSEEALESLFKQLREGVAPLPLIAGLASDPDLVAACKVPGGVSSCILIGIGEVVGAVGDVVTTTDATANTQIQALATATANSIQTKLCTPPANCDPSVVQWLQKLADPTVQANVASALQQLFADARNLYQTVEGWKKSSAQDTATLLSRAGDVLNGVNTLGDDSVGVLQAPWPTSGSTNETCASGDALCTKVEGVVKSWRSAEPIVLAAADALKGQYSDAAREVLIFAQDNASKLSLPPQLVQYIGFAVDVSQAKTASDVKSLLDNAAAPVGSYRLKRQKTFVLSVTSLVGFAGGFETPTSSQNTGGTVNYGGMHEAGGLMATLGLDASLNLGAGWTLGIYGNALDVGQLISTPFGNSGGTSTSQPVAGGEVSLAQVLAPGGYLRLGLGNTPFVFGVGATEAPSLRKYQHLADSGSDQVSVVRFQAFLSMDLTLFPFVTCGGP